MDPVPLEPDDILAGLKDVKVVPVRPPDHEHMTAFDPLPPLEGVEKHTARGVLVRMSDAEWAHLWSRFIAFLIRAAARGDGVRVE